MSANKTLIVAMPPVLVCEECWKRVSGDGGYLAVDVDTAARQTNGYKVNWRIVHEACDADRKPTDYLIWARRFDNTNDLLLEMADLSDRKVWFRATNWQGLVRRILADTNHYAENRLGKRGRNAGNGISTVFGHGNGNDDE